MNILVAYSSLQLGFDPIVKEFAFELSKRGDNVVLFAVEGNIPKEVFEVDFDIVILMEALSWYLKNRLRIIGRPWVGLVAFSFSTLAPYVSMPIADSGVHAIFSNCQVFVTQSNQQIPALFAWKPILKAWSEPDTNYRIKLGTVLPNILDRDFSALVLASKIFKEAGHPEDFRVFVRADESMRLPADLEQHAVEYHEDGEIRAFKALDYFLLSPRITDYRAGLTPPEVFKAIECGCTPLLVYHPALDCLKESVQPMCHSLMHFKSSLSALAQTDIPIDRLVTASIPPNMRVTVSEYVEKIMLGYQRWRVNAAAS